MKWKRLLALKRPENNRKFKYKRKNETQWNSAEVIESGKRKEENQNVCELKLQNEETINVDFSNDHHDWCYENFACKICKKEYPTK